MKREPRYVRVARQLRRPNRPGALVLPTILIAGFLIGFADVLPRPRIQVEWDDGQDGGSAYEPQRIIEGGSEILMVAVLSSRCHWSNLPELKSAVRQAKVVLSGRAEARGRGFTTLGVARDMSTVAGIAHLREHGAFDEVMAGRGWYNTGLMTFVYGDLPGPAVTPQLLVLEQTVSATGGERRISNRNLLTRKLGSEAIIAWVEQGAPLP